MLALLITTASCNGNPPNVNSELICPNNLRILVKFVREKDLKLAIQEAYAEKKRLRTSESYTLVKLRDGRSLAIRQIPAEVAVTCIVQESFIGFADQSYVYTSY